QSMRCTNSTLAMMLSAMKTASGAIQEGCAAISLKVLPGETRTPKMRPTWLIGPGAGGSGAPEATTGGVTIANSSTTDFRTQVCSIYVPSGATISPAGKEKHTCIGPARVPGA